MKKEMEKYFEKGITLVALVVTIIVLLILAGVAITLTVGNNGIFNRASSATKEYTKASIKEELELAVADARMDNLYIINNEKIAEKLENIGAIIIDVDDMHITGEYKDYTFEVDKDGNISIGDTKISGVKPDIKVEILTNAEDAEKNELVEIKVTVSTSEGEISGVESLNGAVLDESKQNTDTEKYYKVTENGIYKFKVTGTNSRINIGKVQVNILTQLIQADSIFDGIEKVNKSGRYYIKINGKEEKYSVNIINQVGDMVLNGTNEYDGSKILNSNTYEFGTDTDVATASTNAKNTVVLKVDGNLTVNEDITLTTIKNASYGGPKGLIIYCTGNLENNGTIDMTARGAKAVGEDVYLFKNKTTNTFEYIPAIGGAGGAAYYINVDVAWHNGPTLNGNKGANGINRSTGGGGSGQGLRDSGGTVSIGRGGNGTSYSGGTGSGGATTRDYNGATGDRGSGSGSDIGGPGSAGVSGSSENSSSGVGNPSGGTGGLLVIRANLIKNNSNIFSKGSASAGASLTGGGSGGGSINIFYKSKFENIGTIDANGVPCPVGYSSRRGGAGGNGTITIGSISTGDFVSDK